MDQKKEKWMEEREEGRMMDGWKKKKEERKDEMKKEIWMDGRKGRKKAEWMD